MTTEKVTPAHEQRVDHHYVIRYPSHEPREHDPHYEIFEAFRRRTKATAVCWVGAHSPAKAAECRGGLEAHHSGLEFALANSRDLTAIMKDFPDVKDEESFQKWLEADQIRWLCTRHHRGDLGAHSIAHADWEANVYADHILD